MAIRVTLVSIPVEDQDHALAFYRDKLGFVVKHDDDMGNGARWLTLIPPNDPDGTEILLEPNGDYPTMKALKQALRDDGMPITQFDSDDLAQDVINLTAAGVRFTSEIIDMAGARVASFADTWGNTVMLVETKDG